MNKIKSPFIQNINKSAQIFHTKIKAFEKKLHEQYQDQMEEVKQKSQIVQSKYRQFQLDTQENANQNEEATGSACQISGEKAQRNHKKNTISQYSTNFMKQWKGNNQFAFANMQQVKENFINVFSKKLSVKKKQNKKKYYDFIEDQKIMLKNIFNQIQNPHGFDKGFVSIQRVVQFFEQNSLFYLFYDLHPNRIKYVLKQFARTRGDSLTKVQFLHVFFMDRPLMKDLSDPYQKVVRRKCILDDEGWLELKNLFTTLDTFGNETIHIRPFFHKLKTYHSNPNLIYSPVIQFPQIQRIYTLQKLVFDLQHKFQFKDKVQWKDIVNIITNFNHRQQPTLDAIFESHLLEATILFDSNYFLVDKKIIVALKGIFEKCPKFSQFFVNTKFICNQVLQCPELKASFKNPIRQKTNACGGYINLQQAIRYMAAKAPHYIDLDQFLQFFSIKGPVTNLPWEHPQQIQTSDSEKQSFQQQRKMLRAVRSQQKLNRSRRAKKSKKPTKQVTYFQQFNLTTKQKQSILERRLKQMLQQKQQTQLKQLRNKFKANPIPANTNPQRLKQQQRRKDMKKKKKLQQIAKQRQEDKQMISYLRANTKLFEPLNKENGEGVRENSAEEAQLRNVRFVHKPVPWYVQENLLEAIQDRKAERKRKIYEEARLKYARSWNRLPDFFFHQQQNDDSASKSIQEDIKNNQKQPRRLAIKANPVPDFRSLQKQFQASLEKKKKMFQPTQIQQFNLTTHKIQKMEIQQHYLSPRSKKNQKSNWREIINSPPSNKIPTTKKTEQWMSHNKNIQQQKRLMKEAIIIKQKQRTMKQKNFARFMSQKLHMQDQNMPDLQAQTAQKLKRHQKNVQYLQRETQKQLSQIYERVLQRPFLFEINSQKYYNTNGSNKHKKGKKSNQKGVIKSIQPINMSEQSGGYNQYYQNKKNEQQNQAYHQESHSQNNYSQINAGQNQSF